MTPQHSHHPYILCHLANYAHHKTTCTLLAYSHPLNNQTRHLPTAHSTAFHIQDISHVQQYNKISQHNLHSNMPYRLSTACALHSFCIQDRPYLPCSVAIALQPPKTQLTLHSHQHALNMHPALPNPLPSTTLLCTQLTQGIVGKMAQDVGMV